MYELLYYGVLQQLFNISVLFLVLRTHLNHSYTVKYFEQLISQVVAISCY